MNHNDVQAQLIQRMLKGDPFTYSSLCVYRGVRLEGRQCAYDEDRLVDRTIQKLRKAGKITFTREGRSVVWRPVTAQHN